MERNKNLAQNRKKCKLLINSTPHSRKNKQTKLWKRTFINKLNNSLICLDQLQVNN